MPSKIASRYDLAERLTEDDFIWRWGSNILPKILPSKNGKQKNLPLQEGRLQPLLRMVRLWPWTGRSHVNGHWYAK